MAQVHIPAILDAVAATTVQFNTTTQVTPTTPPADSMLGTPVLSLYNIIPDLPNSKVQFSYFISQFYTAADGVTTGYAFASGQSGLVSIPGVAQSPAGITVTATPASTSSLTGGKITFAINATVGYNRITPAKYEVYIEQ